MGPRASERGAVAPASLLAAAVVAVAIGTAGYALTSGPSERVQQQAASIQADHSTNHSSAPSAGTTSPSAPASVQSPTAAPTAAAIDRTAYSVAIYNASNIAHLAARTATKAQNVGWKVVATSQWLGTIDSSTVYYPPSMQAAAQQLASDLGISATKPAISPMQMDRLTVILTSSYSG